MIVTPRLQLRRCRLADVDAVLAYRSRRDVATHLSSGVWSRDKAEHELAAYADAPFSAPGDELVLLVETLEPARVIGEVGLVWRDGNPKTAEVGYVFHPHSGGQGFATEAVGALIDAAFDTFGFVAVVARTDESNLASRALCERVGMRLLSISDAADARGARECLYSRDTPAVRQD
jgi:RimJ/RimL family protein N-acetyltransferase